MIAIPAIDLRGGKVVRLRQGKKEEATVYGDNPLHTALHWQNLGAPMLHVVDLDGAFAGRSVESEQIGALVQSLRIPVELGGGIRNLETIDFYLKMGVSRVILGSAAVTNQELVKQALELFSPERIVLGVDALDGKIATHGWEEIAPVSVLDFLSEWADNGIRHIIYTDISRDGMLSGPDVHGVQKIAATFSFQMVVSGGISEEKDVLQFCGLPNIEGVILGKALYAGAVDFPRLLEKMERKQC